MTYYYIYKITCTAGSFKDKFYFGQHTTTNLDDGYKGSGKKLQNYYKTYPNDYIKEIICFCKDIDDLNQKEYEVIKPWLNNKMCLNLKHGGCGNELSEETKKKISDKMKEVMKHQEVRKKISEARKGKPAWNKGKKASLETRKKLSESHKGYIVTEETRKKISEAHKGYIATEETRKKLSEALKGKSCPIKGKHRVYREDGTFYMQ